MIKINLLPKNEKSSLKAQRLSNFLMIVSLYDVLVLILIAGALFFVSGTYNNRLSDLDNNIAEAKMAIEQQKNDELETNVEELNRIGKRLNGIYNKQTSWHTLLNELTQLTPDTIIWKQIAIKKWTHTINLSGHATTRDDFVSFSDNIENSDNFSDVESPLSNLTSKEDIDFTMTFTFTDNNE
ncbi:MAG: PilN domain-containing protein [bacterium]